MTASAVESTASSTEIAARRSRGLFVDAWRRLLQSWNGRIGLTLVSIIVLTALLAPIVNPYDPSTDSNLKLSRKPPSREHALGTDRLGRDLGRRIVHGTRISLAMGVVVVLLAGAAGVAVGMVAGYFGRAADTILMRLMDVLLAFPSILLAIAIVAVRGPGIANTMLAVAVVGIPGYARVMRSMVLSLRERPAHHAAPHPAQQPVTAHRAGHSGHRRGDPLCRRARVPRPGRAAALTRMGRDDLGRHPILADLATHGILSRHRDHADRAWVQPPGRWPA
jgi:peptide/nickel transport system permease protein